MRYAEKNPKSYYHSNVDGFKLFKIFIYKNPKKFIFASSSSVYGKNYPVKETTKLKPKNYMQKLKNLMKNTLKKNLEMRIYKLLVYDCLLSMVNGVDRYVDFEVFKNCRTKKSI